MANRTKKNSSKMSRKSEYSEEYHRKNRAKAADFALKKKRKQKKFENS